MVVIRATSAFLFLALAACSVGEVPGGAAPPTDAPPGNTPDAPPGMMIDAAPMGDPGAASFAAMVTPIVTKDIEGKQCSQGGCHAGTFPPNLADYSKLAAKYKIKPGADNILVKKGAHMGPALPPADAATIAAWIESLP
jgi:hypothetical protein